jgi:Kef-type K+ transport system membrane component KefB
LNVLLILSAGAPHGPDNVPTLLLALAFVMVAAKLAGALFERLGQPAVLGELLVGIVLGNLTLLGGPDLAGLQANETLTVLAELGAILLLFQVGLESTAREMMAVGGRAALVAMVGVVAPMALGFGVGELLHPDESWMLHAFLGAMLAATSVGITARVLKDVDALPSLARIILGAAVIDDVLGCWSCGHFGDGQRRDGAGAQPAAVGLIVLKAVLFLAGALLVGTRSHAADLPGRPGLRSTGGPGPSLLCFVLASWRCRPAWRPSWGGFAAGLVLEDIHFEDHVRRGERPLTRPPRADRALVPVSSWMGRDLRSFSSASVIGFASVLTLAAIAGKLACGLATPSGMSGLTVGLGMMPRGEVGLIFAGIGAQLMLGGRPVIDPATYAAAVFMVVVTTVATPPLLLWSMRRPGSAS